MIESIIIGKILGPVLIIVGVAIIVNPKIINYLIKIESTNVSIFIESACRVLLGVIMITIHNYRGSLLEVLISLISWTILIFGIIGLISPELMRKIDKPLFTKATYVNLWMTVIIGLGMILTFSAYAL